MLTNRINKQISIFIILICTLHISRAAFAECSWINTTGGLSSYELTSIASDKQNPDVLYVGTKGFLFKSRDGGESWKNVFNVPGTNKAINFIAVHPDDSRIIYIATESGIFKSAEGGTSWEEVPIGAMDDNVLTLLIGAGNQDVLFAGTKKDVLLIKKKDGYSARALRGISAVNIGALAQDPAGRETLFASAENGVFKSEDNGDSWKKIFFKGEPSEEAFEEDSDEEYMGEITSGWVSLDARDPRTVYIAIKGGVFKSADGGGSWKRLSNIGMPSSGIKNLAVSPVKSGFIFAATENGAFSFSEKENMWKKLRGGPPSDDAIFIEMNGSGDTLWLLAKDGVFKSDGDIYETKEASSDKVEALLGNFSNEPGFREVQEAAIKYAEVHPEKIAGWRRLAKMKALLPKLSCGVAKDKSKSLHWDAGANPDNLVIGPDEEDTGWDITCTWDLGELVWNGDQTLIDVRSRLMVQLRDDVLDEVNNLYFERRRLQVELLRNPPEDLNILVDKELRLQELTAAIDAMTGGYLSREIEDRKK